MDLTFSMSRISNPKDLDQRKEIRIDLGQGQDLKLRRGKLLPRKSWAITLSRELIL
jgi:hypothetical protein